MTETPAQLGDLIGPVIRDLARRSNHDVTRWLRQVDRLRGCTDPIRLTGGSAILNGTTGEVLNAYTTRDEPQTGRLARQRCRGRSRTVLPWR
ncbi:replication initiator [Nonomuraea sp. CA-141351]|uniref:replication initiator n=1 Tax=Nonomuraea sp. CA-141351 TaxID=3239996 RepID=UPI003D8AE873